MKNQQVTQFIDNAPDDQQEIMNLIRDLIHDTVNGVIENYKWSRPVFSLEKDFAYLKQAKNYVTLGFFNFKRIDDKYNQLEGTGKEMRHIKLKKVEDVDHDLLREWFISLTEE